jgi:Heterokaryon incompatibility protein (HET)
MFKNPFSPANEDDDSENTDEKQVYHFNDIQDYGLCRICKRIDFKEIFKFPHNIPGCDKDGKEGKFIVRLGTLKEMQDRKCRLCVFWKDCRVTQIEGEMSGIFELRAYSLSDHNLEFKDFIQILRFDAVFLWVVDINIPTCSFSTLQENGFIIPADEWRHDSRGPVHGNILPPRIDFKVPIWWMEYCDKHHNKSCVTKISSATPEALPEIFVINCEDTLKSGVLQIVKREPEDRFAVLSYVWGQRSKRSQSIDVLSKSAESTLRFDFLPNVIKDAIIATSRIKMRYLWVDRFCLDTGDTELRHTTIIKMHLIYSAAEVAIIATAGKDDEYGLPGVQDTLRVAQNTCKVNNDLTLVSSMESPANSIEQSVWATRAWTLQEGALPRRRLVFTNDQLYFECQQIHCREAVFAPMETFELPLTERSGAKQISDINAYGYFAKNFPQRNGKPMVPLYDVALNMIMQYTKRTMSYESDSLNALLGILHSMGANIGHVWGLPMDLARRDLINSSFVRALTWFHPVSRGGIKPVRRKDFPSWSWVGWKGAVAFHNMGDYQRINPDSVKNVEFNVELKDGSARPITDIIDDQNSLQDAEMNLTNRLWIKTYKFIPNSIKSYRVGNSEHRMWFILNGLRATPAEVRLSVSSKTQTGLLNDICSQKCLPLYVGVDSDMQALFLLVEMRVKFWERIGLMRVRKFESISSGDVSRSLETYSIA